MSEALGWVWVLLRSFSLWQFSTKPARALLVVNQRGKDSSNGLLTRRICPSVFRHCEAASTKQRVCRESVVQVCRSHRGYMLSYRGCVTAFERSGQRPLGIMHLQIRQSAFDQRQKHLLRTPARQSARTKHLKSYVE